MDQRSSTASLHYELKLVETSAGTGFFAALPGGEMDFHAALEYLRGCPFDDFMRIYLIGRIKGWPSEKITQRIGAAKESDDELMQSLLLEACLLDSDHSGLSASLSVKQKKKIVSHTSLVYLKSHLLADHALHTGWAAHFQANIYRHRPLPPPNKCELPLLSEHSLTDDVPAERTVKHIRRRFAPSAEREAPPPAEQTAAIALERLSSLNILVDREQRHESSLSPFALLHHWNLDRTVANGRLNYRFSGRQTAYGKGIELESARASYAMEIVERYSAYAHIQSNGNLLGTRCSCRLIYGRRSELLKGGHQVIDPNLLGLEAPYKDEPLHWIESRRSEAAEEQVVLIPAQCVFLFSNLDEISLYSALGSTGLASGNTMAQAKLNALLEIVERDCEAVFPYHSSRCFRVIADDPKVNALLEDYRQRGIHVQFQDISPDYGVPCCKCFVVHRDGTIAKGASAHLNGRKAVLSALTETPYPYPYGPPSMPVTMDLPVLCYEELPNFSFDDVQIDLKFLEAVLCANGLIPHYVDLTRSDLDLPVVKALIPGLEIMNDFDAFARISPRLFNNYLKIYGR